MRRPLSRRIALGTAALALFALLPALTPTAAAQTCTDGDCDNGWGTYAWPGGHSYTGFFQNSTRTGYGTYTYPNGDSYAGEWDDGTRSGWGRYDYRTPGAYDHYIGTWENDAREGYGLMVYQDGHIDRVYWSADEISEQLGTGCTIGDCDNGLGSFVYSDGDYYVGQWRNGQRHGYGRYYYDNGDVYEGNWINGTRSGSGMYVYTNLDFYVGEWSGDNRNGRGIYIYTNGDVDRGVFRENELTTRQQYLLADLGLSASILERARRMLPGL